MPAEPIQRISGRTSSLTRRTLLRTGGVIAALPFVRPAAAQPAGPIMTTLSTYMSAARERPLPDEVVEKTKQHVLDTFAAMLSGSALVPGRAAIRFARAYGGPR